MAKFTRPLGGFLPPVGVYCTESSFFTWRVTVRAQGVFHMRHLVVHPLSPLLVFSFVLALLLSAYFASGLIPSHAFQVVASFTWSVLLGLWVIGDASRRKLTPCVDFGLFCYLFSPLVVPWYCFTSRGWRGALTLFALIVLWLLPYFVATLVWQAIYT